MEGRILLYDSAKGVGKLMDRERRQYDFNIDGWADFDHMPSTGMFVTFQLTGGTPAEICKKGSAAASGEASSQQPASSSVQTSVARRAAQAKRPAPVEKIDLSDDEARVKSSLGVEETIKNYFALLEPFIAANQEVITQRMEGLDYFLIKRFLFTAFNDLQGLDGKLYFDQELGGLRNEMKNLEQFYEDLQTKLHYEKYCFELVFLGQQPEFVKHEKFKEYAKGRMKKLHKTAEILKPEIGKTQARMDNAGGKTTEEELKKLRKNYVEAIQEDHELKEKLKKFKNLRQIYFTKYYDEFARRFREQGTKYEKLLKVILDYKAARFDRLLWEKAENSPAIQAYFQNAKITGGYGTATFLRYYLDSLDPDQAGDEEKELFKLLEYMESRK